MELEFDKEMNAILRKAGRHSRAVPEDSPHIDADMIAAFAENAVPQRARPPLIEHFAACDGCRETLAQSMVLLREADATAASSLVDIPIELPVPWYRKLFSTPGLALAMGALVIAFTGLIGYLATQNRQAATEVSQVNEPELQRGGPYDGGEPSAPVANTAANTNAFSNETATTGNYPGAGNSNTASVAANPLASRRPEAELRTATADDSGAALDSASSQPAEPSAVGGAKPAAPPPPPPVTADVTKTEADEKKLTGERDKDAELSSSREIEDGAVRRDAPAAAAKSGPARSGPFQMKSKQANNQSFDMSVTRMVGGKTFYNRNGAWYDSAFHGQTTKDIRRGSDEFKKLDSGLRSIANKLGGVVVIVWKDKAYRIQ